MASLTDNPALQPLMRRLRELSVRYPALRNRAQSLLQTALLLRMGPLREGGRKWSADRKTIILCLHDGSLTGAPILGWNLAKQMSDTCNVVCVLLSGGKLEAALAPYCVAYQSARVGSVRSAEAKLFAQRVLAPIRRKYGADCILANSVETEVAVTAGADLGIPSVSLIHEFPLYTVPARLTNVVSTAASVIYSSKMLRDAIADAAGTAGRRAIVAPQGQCQIPQSLHRSAATPEIPNEETSGEFLCIGCGHVQMRKGVDIFIAAAIGCLRQGAKARFLWVGDGYAPKSDFYLGIWLRDQIERSGLASSISITPAVGPDDLDKLYRRADAMFLSSRLDPLPNVAIDALYAGVPVVCFDKASGLAEYLEQDELLRLLIVPYYDIGAAGSRLAELAAHPQLRSQLAARAAAFAREHFDMKRYVDKVLAEIDLAMAKPEH